MFVPANPKVLVWAREERGMTVQEVSEKIGVEARELNNWEKDGKEITFSTLEKLAKLYKRQTAVFFLPDTPPSTKKPKDFRNVAGVRGLFSVETLLAIRRTSRYLGMARELVDTHIWNQQYQWLKNFTGRKNQIEKEAAEMRQFLTGHMDRTLSASDPEDAFRNWRKKVEEKLGVFVFQFKMSESEISGFSYAFDEFPYAIAINNQNHAVKKSFTLFHEVAHILRHDPGACKTENIDDSRTLQVEYDCNLFAGKLLAPKVLLNRTLDINEIFTHGRGLNISGEAYLRRLHEENLITEDQFFDLLGPVREKSNSLPRRDKNEGDEEEEFRIGQAILSKSSRGAKFFDLVASASASNRISYSEASDLLGIKSGYIKL
jgi:Zn-dependent peptidase ImmA (M78 family)/transcriptional regulator with XRE-family HTH domain